MRALAVTLAALLAWQALVSLAALPPFILPGPLRVAEALWTNRALIAANALVTIAEVLLGLVLGAALGAATAIWLAAAPSRGPSSGRSWSFPRRSRSSRSPRS